jgi:hypothetical protein
VAAACNRAVIQAQLVLVNELSSSSVVLHASPLPAQTRAARQPGAPRTTSGPPPGIEAKPLPGPGPGPPWLCSPGLPAPTGCRIPTCGCAGSVHSDRRGRQGPGTQRSFSADRLSQSAAVMTRGNGTLSLITPGRPVGQVEVCFGARSTPGPGCGQEASRSLQRRNNDEPGATRLQRLNQPLSWGNVGASPLWRPL